jgi:hypothetical protein
MRSGQPFFTSLNFFVHFQCQMSEISRSRQTSKHKKISDTLRLNHKLTIDI